MHDLAYYNGTWAPIDEMTIPMNDRASFFGDGVYDALGVMQGVPLDLMEHLNRLYRSADKVRIKVPMGKHKLAELLRTLAARVDSPDQFLYVQVTRGVGPRIHAFRHAGETASLWAFSRPMTFRDLDGEYSVITMEDTRWLHCDIKTVNLLPSVMAAQAAEEAGAVETVFHRGDRVTECAHSNIHIIRDGCLITAPADNLILPGITRAHILSICRRLGIPVQERPFTVEEMLSADEVFFSASDSFTCRVTRIDGSPAGGKDPATFSAIRDAYRAELQQQLASSSDRR